MSDSRRFVVIDGTNGRLRNLPNVPLLNPNLGPNRQSDQMDLGDPCTPFHVVKHA